MKSKRSQVPCPNQSKFWGKHTGLIRKGSIVYNGKTYPKYKCEYCQDLYTSISTFPDGRVVHVNNQSLRNVLGIEKYFTQKIPVGSPISENTQEKNKHNPPASKPKHQYSYVEATYLTAEKLKPLNLYDKLYFKDATKYNGQPVDPKDINEILNKDGKEVTALNGYYVLVKPGFHEQRMKDIQIMRNNPITSVSPEGYRDDISNTNGTFHLRRDITGRIASDIEMDSFD